jgi:Putative transposase
LPHELNPLAAVHDPWVYDTLMACVAATLSEFARNPRWLGAEPAFTLVLHTWTQDLRRHLHVHVLIACGGLDAQGNWLEPKRNPHFLFPVHALSRVCRAKFLDALETAHQAGRLPRDPAATPEAWAYRRRRLLRHDWVVYAKTPLGGPAEVLDYLSRYTTALSNERIVAIQDGEVLLRVRADPQGGKRVIRIPGAVFIGRFLQQVLPPGFKRIRHYGLLASARKRERLAQARQALRLPEPSPPALETAEDFLRRVAQKEISRCPCCEHGTLRIGAALPPDHSAVVRPHPVLLPRPTLMATLPLVPSKKWRWFARDLLGFGYARSRQSLIIPGVPPSLGPLFWGLASFPLAVPIGIRLIPTPSTCLALTLRPNKCINPQVHSAPQAV